MLASITPLDARGWHLIAQLTAIALDGQAFTCSDLDDLNFTHDEPCAAYLVSLAVL
jgi:hypothetical protein